MTNCDNDAKFRDAAREAGAGYYVPKDRLRDIRAILLRTDAARDSAL